MLKLLGHEREDVTRIYLASLTYTRIALLTSSSSYILPKGVDMP